MTLPSTGQEAIKSKPHSESHNLRDQERKSHRQGAHRAEVGAAHLTNKRKHKASSESSYLCCLQCRWHGDSCKYIHGCVHTCIHACVCSIHSSWLLIFQQTKECFSREKKWESSYKASLKPPFCQTLCLGTTLKETVPLSDRITNPRTRRIWSLSRNKNGTASPRRMWRNRSG